MIPKYDIYVFDDVIIITPGQIRNKIWTIIVFAKFIIARFVYLPEVIKILIKNPA